MNISTYVQLHMCICIYIYIFYSPVCAFLHLIHMTFHNTVKKKEKVEMSKLFIMWIVRQASVRIVKYLHSLKHIVHKTVECKMYIQIPRFMSYMHAHNHLLDFFFTFLRKINLHHLLFIENDFEKWKIRNEMEKNYIYFIVQICV